MTTNANARIKVFMSRLDWSLLKGSAVLTIGTILGRGFGFIGSFLLARFFDPADYGVIQYAISLAMVIAIGIQPIGQHVVARYVGMSNTKPEQLKEFLSNIWLILAVICALSFFLAVPLLLITGKFNYGILVIFLSVSVFFIYLGLARGYLATGRYVAADAGSSFAKVVMILVFIWALNIKSTMLAMLIHGLSFVVPLILLQAFWPLKMPFERKLIKKQITGAILKFSMPIWLSHASYMLYTTVALLFLEHYTDNTTVGIFSLAATLSIMFSFLPTGLSTFLMPKIAGSTDKKHKALLLNALGAAMLINLFLLFVYYFAAPWLVKTFFSAEYLIYPEVFFMLAVANTFLGAQGIITSVFVGSGRAQEETKSRLVTVIVTILACWILVPASGAVGAAWAMLIGIVFGLMVFGLIYLWDQLHPDRV